MFYASYILMLFTAAILVEDNLDVDMHESMVEICDNAIDDDGDGLIDINDSDCICEITTQAKLIPNPSFEEISCCEATVSLDMVCLDDWKSFNSSSTFVSHSCQPFTSLDQLKPYADGESAIGFFYTPITIDGDTSINNNYIATCLYRPMLKDSSYKIKFDVGFLNFRDNRGDRFELTFFGSTSCSNIPAISKPFFDNGVIDLFTTICPSFLPEWSELNKVTVFSEKVSLSHWVGDSIVITPDEDIYAIAIGGPCTIPSEAMFAAYLFDNLRLDGEGSYQDVSEGSQCDPNFLFGVNADSLFTYQWYKEGVALIGEREPVLSQLYGEGDYQIRLVNINNQKCEIGTGLKYEIPEYTSELYKVICQGGSIAFNNNIYEEEGLYEINLLSVDGCDSIVTLILTKEEIDPDTVVVKKLPTVPYSFGSSVFQSEGVYNVGFTSTGGCDSTVVLVLDDLDIYIPNIFSPNGDNTNDVFQIVTSDEDFSTKEMSIFNRWGNLIYEGESWDGSYNNSAAPAGVYVCRVKLVDIDGQIYLHTSTVTLIN